MSQHNGEEVQRQRYRSAWWEREERPLGLRSAFSETIKYNSKATYASFSHKLTLLDIMKLSKLMNNQKPSTLLFWYSALR